MENNFFYKEEKEINPCYLIRPTSNNYTIYFLFFYKSPLVITVIKIVGISPEAGGALTSLSGSELSVITSLNELKFNI